MSPGSCLAPTSLCLWTKSPGEPHARSAADGLYGFQRGVRPLVASGAQLLTETSLPAGMTGVNTSERLNEREIAGCQ